MAWKGHKRMKARRTGTSHEIQSGLAQGASRDGTSKARASEEPPPKDRKALNPTATPGTDREHHHPIGELARAAGVSTRTVRYYEEIGLLHTARRYAGGRRVFDGDALERLRFIGRLKRLGFSLEEIGELNAVFAMRNSTAEMLRALDEKLEQHVTELQVQMGELSLVKDDLGTYRKRIQGRLRRSGQGVSSRPGQGGR